MGALFSLNTVHIQPEDNHEENNPQTQVLNPEQVVYNFPINSQSLKTSLGSVPESQSVIKILLGCQQNVILVVNMINRVTIIEQ